MSILTLSGNELFSMPGRSGVQIGHIAPAATFTATAASSASGGTKTTLTSAGAHGLTAAVAVGKTINITAGTGWTAGFYNISSIDLDTTGVAITIDVAYDAGMGAPTIVLAGSESTYRTITIPALSIDGHLEIDALWSMPNNGNTKIPRIRLAGTSIYNPSLTASAAVKPSSVVLQNRGATNSQVCFSAAQAGQNGAVTTAVATYAIDTSVETSLTITGQANTANDFVFLERYIVRAFR